MLPVVVTHTYSYLFDPLDLNFHLLFVEVGPSLICAEVIDTFVGVALLGFSQKYKIYIYLTLNKPVYYKSVSKPS